jgi:hypothetical protein
MTAINPRMPAALYLYLFLYPGSVDLFLQASVNSEYLEKLAMDCPKPAICS